MMLLTSGKRSSYGVEISGPCKNVEWCSNAPRRSWVFTQPPDKLTFRCGCANGCLSALINQSSTKKWRRQAE